MVLRGHYSTIRPADTAIMDPEHQEALDHRPGTHMEREGEGKTHDSMVTVRLSETPLTIDTQLADNVLTEVEEPDENEEYARRELEDIQESPTITMRDPNGNEMTSPTGSEFVESPDDAGLRRDSESSDEGADGVNWEELEKTEEQEPRDQGSDDVLPLSPPS